MINSLLGLVTGLLLVLAIGAAGDTPVQWWALIICVVLLVVAFALYVREKYGTQRRQYTMNENHKDIPEVIHMASPIPLRCRLDWHKWGGWGRPEARTSTNVFSGKEVTVYSEQRRHCVLCWKTEERIVV